MTPWSAGNPVIVDKEISYRKVRHRWAAHIANVFIRGITKGVTFAPKIETGTRVILHRPSDRQELPRWIEEMDYLDGKEFVVDRIAGGTDHTIIKLQDVPTFTFNIKWVSPAVPNNSFGDLLSEEIWERITAEDLIRKDSHEHRL